MSATVWKQKQTNTPPTTHSNQFRLFHDSSRQQYRYVHHSLFYTTHRISRRINVTNNNCNFNLLNPGLNPIFCLLALLGAHHFLHVSRIRVQSLTLRLLMSYIYMCVCGAPILDVSRSHTTTHHSRWDSWDRGFESHRGDGYLSVVSVVCCQVEVSARSWSLVQRSPTDCAASLCVI
jgi:hypothetical protein